MFIFQHIYDDIVSWYRDECYRSVQICSFVPSIGKSVEGQNMPAVHIRYGAPEFVIYFQCQIHACIKYRRSILKFVL